MDIVHCPPVHVQTEFLIVAIQNCQNCQNLSILRLIPRHDATFAYTMRFICGISVYKTTMALMMFLYSNTFSKDIRTIFEWYISLQHYMFRLLPTTSLWWQWWWWWRWWQGWRPWPVTSVSLLRATPLPAASLLRTRISLMRMARVMEMRIILWKEFIQPVKHFDSSRRSATPHDHNTHVFLS